MRDATELFYALSKICNYPQPTAPYIVVEPPKLNYHAACFSHLQGYHTVVMATVTISTITIQYYKSNSTGVSGTVWQLLWLCALDI